MPHQNDMSPDHVSAKNSPDNQSYTLITYNFDSETPWTHSAVQIGDCYMSLHPSAHATPSESPSVEWSQDTSDFSLTLLAIVRALKPMISDRLIFGDIAEPGLYAHKKIEVPINYSQYLAALALAEKIKREGDDGKLKYSVFERLGVCCSSFTNQVLKTITANTAEENLAKHSFIERMFGITWPQAEFARHTKVANRRRYPEKTGAENHGTTPVNKPLPHLFFARTYLATLHQAALKQANKENHGLKVERAGYGF